jgi:hypothetical protein
MFTAVRMNITDGQGSAVCLMNTGETPFKAGYPELVTGILPCSSPVTASKQDAERNSCSSGLASASGGKAGWLVGPMNAGGVSCQ